MTVDFGDPRMPSRFWAKVCVVSTGCWLWTAHIDRGGYGSYGISRGRMHGAHRVAFKVLCPDQSVEGLTLDHLCRVRRCVNPGHLEPVTHAENCRRGNARYVNGGKTHCPQNHPYSIENTLVVRGKRGLPERQCRTCNRERARERRRLKREGLLL